MKLSKEWDENRKNAAILEIQAVMKANKDLRMHERYQTILLALYGEDYEQIARVTGRSIATLCAYVKAYRQSGIAGLQMEHSTYRI